VQQDPWITDQIEGLNALGNFQADFLSKDNEVRRYRFVQLQPFSVGGEVGLTIVPSAGKVGGIMQLIIQETSTASPQTITYRGANNQNQFLGYSVDVPAGAILRCTFFDNISNVGGRAIVAYERITLNRLRAEYGPAVQFNPATGLIDYPDQSVQVVG